MKTLKELFIKENPRIEPAETKFMKWVLDRFQPSRNAQFEWVLDSEDGWVKTGDNPNDYDEVIYLGNDSSMGDMFCAKANGYVHIFIGSGGKRDVIDREGDLR